ncbi:MAG: hypothetical protein HY584_06350 [Candidatus Omnitrophica bacterium]|nr:hypothetical protein [Candidatus Omnitrophota bacterium]
MLKIVQSYPLRYFAKVALLADDGKINEKFKSLFQEYERDYKYTDFQPDPVEIRNGESGWSGICFILFIIAILYPMLFGMEFNLAVCLILILSVVSFLMKFVKQKYTVLTLKDNAGFLWIKIPKKNNSKELEFIAYIENKIKGTLL